MAFINMPNMRELQDITQEAYRFLGGLKGWESAALLARIMKAQAILTNAADGIADPGLREVAHDQYGTDDIEIDDEPATAQADGGTWVAAWVWIAQPEEDEEENECQTCAASIETRAAPCDECGHIDL